MPIPPQVIQCYKYIDSKQKDFVKELRELVSIPNISSNSGARSHVDTVIKWLEARLVLAGFRVDMKSVGSYTPSGQTTAVGI